MLPFTRRPQVVGVAGDPERSSTERPRRPSLPSIALIAVLPADRDYLSASDGNFDSGFPPQCFIYRSKCAYLPPEFVDLGTQVAICQPLGFQCHSQWLGCSERVLGRAQRFGNIWISIVNKSR